MKQSFFENDKALLTVMVQADNPDRIKELIDKENKLLAMPYSS